MTSGRNLLSTILLAATILFVSSRVCHAQNDAPPPRMLLNLDLFTSRAPSRPGAPSDSDDSMLNQVRALRAMGYLSPDGPVPDVEGDSDQPPPRQPANGIPINGGVQQ
jgi:hypothetical protein